MLEDLKGNYVVDGKDRFIDIEMQVAFSNSDVRGFLNDTVADWLRGHAEREGVPYVIVTDSIDINPKDLQKVGVLHDLKFMQTLAQSSCYRICIKDV